jgi:GNAT superfamily N-acetyltransferase
MRQQRLFTALRGTTVRAISHPSEIARLVEDLEPRSIHVSSLLHEQRISRRHRIWMLENAAAEVTGLVSVSQWVRDRWLASPLIFDPSAGSAAAEVIDRSPAWGVIGALQDIQPVFPHLTRRIDREPRVMAFFSGGRPIPELEHDDPRIRLATEGDLEDLYGLYELFESDAIPTRMRVRKLVRECFGRGPLLVATVDDAIAGAVRVDGHSQNYLLWGGLTVDPAFRGQGLGLSLTLTAIGRTRDASMGACMIRDTTNPMSFRQLEPGIETGALEAELWSAVALRPPLRIRGHGKARRALETIEGRTRRRRSDFDRGIAI